MSSTEDGNRTSNSLSRKDILFWFQRNWVIQVSDADIGACKYKYLNVASYLRVTIRPVLPFGAGAAEPRRLKVTQGPIFKL